MPTAPAPVEERAGAATTAPQPAAAPVDDGAGTVTRETPVEDIAGDPVPVTAADSASGPDPAEPVVLAFLDEAESLAADGKTGHAIASLERGIRVKPRDPWLWHQLGVLKLRAGQWLDAISIAEKSNSLAGDNRELIRGNWLVIADANEALGNLAAAEKARRMAAGVAPY